VTASVGAYWPDWDARIQRPDVGGLGHIIPRVGVPLYFPSCSSHFPFLLLEPQGVARGKRGKIFFFRLLRTPNHSYPVFLNRPFGRKSNACPLRLLPSLSFPSERVTWPGRRVPARRRDPGLPPCAFFFFFFFLFFLRFVSPAKINLPGPWTRAHREPLNANSPHKRGKLTFVLFFPPGPFFLPLRLNPAGSAFFHNYLKTTLVPPSFIIQFGSDTGGRPDSDFWGPGSKLCNDRNGCPPLRARSGPTGRRFYAWRGFFSRFLGVGGFF